MDKRHLAFLPKKRSETVYHILLQKAKGKTQFFYHRAVLFSGEGFLLPFLTETCPYYAMISFYTAIIPEEISGYLAAVLPPLPAAAV
ncbi:MAG: hypothetical protein IJO67_08015 [Clostridia bacterium]|nr:hypothetical protein [Clostridia bacterium]